MLFYIQTQYNTKILWAITRNFSKPKRLKDRILQLFEIHISGSANPGKIIFKSWNFSWHDIRKRKIQYFKLISKSTVVTKKHQKKLMTEIFGIFEPLLTHNSNNQDSQLSWFFETIWKTVRKFKNMGLQWIISAWEWFQNLFHNKFCKIVEKLNFMVFRALFLFGVHIQQRCLTYGKSSWSVIRKKKTEHSKIS